MRKLILIMIAAISLPAMAAAETDSGRVVLEAQHSFDRIIVNGDITVEITFNPAHKGYIVYNTGSDKPLIQCFNDSSTLILSGSRNRSGITSRVTVVACDSIVSVINNGDKAVLIKQLPKVNTLDLVVNGTGDIKAGKLQAGHTQLIDNSRGNITVDELQARFAELITSSEGSIGINHMKCHGCKVINAGNGDISIPDLLTRRGLFATNSAGSINIGGKADAAAMTATGNGSINAVSFKVKRINTSTYGTGQIKLSPANKKLNNNQTNNKSL